MSFKQLFLYTPPFVHVSIKVHKEPFLNQVAKKFTMMMKKKCNIVLVVVVVVLIVINIIELGGGPFWSERRKDMGLIDRCLGESRTDFGSLRLR